MWQLPPGPHLSIAVREEFARYLAAWKVTADGPLQERLEQVVAPALQAGVFGTSAPTVLSGLQYHLGGAVETRDLARLASLSAQDSVLDVCCYLGGPALQLAEEAGCRVTGVDISERAIAAALRLAELAGLSGQAEFRVADAAHLPFAHGTFSVVWNQGSLNHEERWLDEMCRVLALGGRIALSPSIRGPYPDVHSPRWTLAELVGQLSARGCIPRLAEDTTTRDLREGWGTLLDRLERRRSTLLDVLGAAWLREAEAEITEEMAQMRAGRWGTARIVAEKVP